MSGGATWEQGDFNGDGKVDVSDLGILAANYGSGVGGSLDFNRDAKAFGLVFGVGDLQLQDTQKEEIPITQSLGGCSATGFPLIAGVLLMGMVFYRLDGLERVFPLLGR